MRKSKMFQCGRITAVMAAAFGVIVLGAVSGETARAAEGESICVVVPRHELDSTGVIENKVRQFEEETGISVELINAAWDVCTDKIRTELSVGGSSYDVVDFDNSLVAMYIENDWLEPLDGYEGAAEIKEALVDGLADKFTVDGTFYGVTWNNDTHVYMYNARMLEDAGISKPPKTWDELIEASRILIEQGICSYGTPMSFWGNAAVNEMTYVMYAFGGNAFKDGELCIGQDPNTLKAFETIASMMEEGLIDPASLSYDYETAANVFLSGESAFFLQAMPGMYAASNDPEQSQIVGEVKVAPYSVTSSEDTNVVLTVPEAFAIPKNSQHKEAAWEFIRYMSSKEFDKEKALELGTLPVYEEGFEDPDILEKYPHFTELGKQNAYAKGIDDFTWYDEYSNVFQSELQRMLLGEITAQECVTNIQEQCAEFAK
ncbi:MAG: sugar ABC transporter substrate-binding protein [Eubacteriales bacterium]|nr:sugar ABC transporter substrate-binding protein [Eubacteriales bacterium]